MRGSSDGSLGRAPVRKAALRKAVAVVLMRYDVGIGTLHSNLHPHAFLLLVATGVTLLYSDWIRGGERGIRRLVYHGERFVSGW